MSPKDAFGLGLLAAAILLFTLGLGFTFGHSQACSEVKHLVVAAGQAQVLMTLKAGEVCGE